MTTPKISTIMIKKVDLNKNTTQTIQMSGFVGSKPIIDYKIDPNCEVVNSNIPDDVKFTEDTQIFTLEIQHKTQSTSRTLTATRTIDYSVSDDKHTIKPTVQNLEIKQIGIRDLVTNKVTWQEPTKQYYFEGIKSPILAGYTPDLSSVEREDVDLNNLDVNVIVNYMPNPQIATVKIFDETTNKKLTDVTLAGFTSQPIITSVELETMLIDYKEQGYLVVDNPIANNNLSFADDTKIKITLKHHLVNVPTTNPQTGEDISDKLTKTVKRTINFEGFDSVVQSHTFKRSASFDYVTHKMIYNAWSKNTTFESVPVPEKPGYKPSVAEIDAVAITPKSTNETVQVSYTPLKRKITLSFYDETGQIELDYLVLNGVSDEVSDYDLESKLASYQNYELVNDTLPTLKFDPLVENKKYTFNLTHKILKITADNQTDYDLGVKDLSRTISRTINLVIPHHENTEPVIQSHTFKRVATYDLVTKVITYSDWEDDVVFDRPNLPKVDGYYVINTVPKVAVKANNHSQTLTLTYKPDMQKMEIDVLDETTGDVIKTISLRGDTDEHLNKNYDANKLFNFPNYNIVSNPVNDQFDSLIFMPGMQKFTVKLTHKVVKLTETNSINPLTGADFKSQLVKYNNLVINFKTTDGKILKPAQTKAFKLVRSAKLDLVSSNITYNAWHLVDSNIIIDAPHIDDYTPSKQQVEINDLKLLDTKSYFNFWYHLTKQNVTFDFVDTDTGDIVDHVSRDVYYNNPKSNYHLKTKFDELIARGYNVLTENNDAVISYDETLFSKKRYYKIKVSQNKIIDYDVRDLTRTIIISEPENQTRQIKQSATLRRKRITNAVTKKTTYSDWGQSYWDAVIMTPIVGYEVDTVLVKGKHVTSDSKNETVYVTYKKMHQALTSDSIVKQKTGFMHKLAQMLGFEEMPQTPKTLTAPKKRKKKRQK